ncbi:MAG: nucleotidyltransferase family protein [Acidobacteriaceae bacterium]|nr:nucleotidyltransferase family protein [Acidobacteriaceae bacterium]
MSAPSCITEIPQLALLAGGLATRLGPLTARVPKSLLPIAGEPFIAHQLRLLVGQGVCDIVICSGHLGEQIEEFVGDGSRFGCLVRYSHDGDVPLGTGGAIRNALPLLGPCFWVMYGDSYLTAPFAPALRNFRDSALLALMTVYANADRWDSSNVSFNGGKILRYNKSRRYPGMQHIDYGLSLFSASVFAQWPEGSAFDLADLQSRLVEQGIMAGHEVFDRFYEIGSPTGLHETELFLTESLRVSA